MSRYSKKRDGLNPSEVKAWFAQHAGGMVVALDSGDYFGTYKYLDENENVFFSADGREMLKCEVSYEDGCPTCGGAYVKRWTLTAGPAA